MTNSVGSDETTELTVTKAFFDVRNFICGEIGPMVVNQGVVLEGKLHALIAAVRADEAAKHSTALASATAERDEARERKAELQKRLEYIGWACYEVLPDGDSDEEENDTATLEELRAFRDYVSTRFIVLSPEERSAAATLATLRAQVGELETAMRKAERKSASYNSCTGVLTCGHCAKSTEIKWGAKSINHEPKCPFAILNSETLERTLLQNCLHAAASAPAGEGERGSISARLTPHGIEMLNAINEDSPSGEQARDELQEMAAAYDRKKAAGISSAAREGGEADAR